VIGGAAKAAEADGADIERLIEAHDALSAQLQTLAAHRVRRILLVASLYDSFTLSEGEHLAELISGAFHNLAPVALPELTRVSTRARALEALAHQPFDMVITFAHIDDVAPDDFGSKAKRLQPDIPVFVLAFNMRQLQSLPGGPIAIPHIDGSFLWRGDVRLFLALIALAEDRLNAEHDARVGGVRMLILIEDSVPFYSSYLPMLFGELMKQTEILINQSVNVGQRILRRRLRPHVMMAATFEDGMALYERFRDNVLAVLCDVRFPRGGVEDAEAGLALLGHIRARDAETPLLLQSSRDRYRAEARELGAQFVNKNSRTLLGDFRAFMLEHLGFGDFVFRDPAGQEVARAADIEGMLAAVEALPDEVLESHASRNHFSNWLMARTEFALATEMRKVRVSDFASIAEMRAFLHDRLTRICDEQHRGQVEDFRRGRFASNSRFVRVGGGSLGGKGRGLAFMYELLSRGNLDADLPDVRVFVPPSAVVATDVFDRFVDQNALRDFALREEDDAAILARFLDATMPDDAVADLAAFLERIDYPIAVRSSSLLEDSHHLPAAGVYPTFMLPNNQPDPAARLAALLDAVRHIYAATFFAPAKAYFASTASRVEEEKMAVVIQQIVGKRHGDVVYPNLAGVAQSHNFYPVRQMRAEDGVATVALGFGRTVVDGGRAVRFSPAYPEWLPQFASPEEILDHAQRRFWALDVSREPDLRVVDPLDGLVELGLDAAERHGTLWPVASVHSPEDDAVHDGLTRPGTRVVTMAPILKHGAFPLCQILARMLDLGRLGMSGPVEIEFAINLRDHPGTPHEFAFLQIRPLELNQLAGTSQIDDIDEAEVFIRAPRALGVGRNSSIRDVVAVREDTFHRAHTAAIAEEIGQVNQRLLSEGRPYLLIGPGRWGTADRWLGIPVAWSQIAGARVIVERGLDDLEVEPSQGTHFFHNMTSLGIGYFTIGRRQGGTLDAAWLAARPIAAEGRYVRHHRLDEPLEVLIDSREGTGVILKRPHERQVQENPEPAR